MKNEIWRDIPSYENLYQVSNCGRVKSFHGTDIRILKLSMNSDEYCRVVLYKKNKCRRLSVHRLVLLVFVGPCPEGMECCHGDGNSSNNDLSNLRWDTHKNNNIDKIKHETSKHSEKTKEKMSESRRGKYGGVDNPMYGRKHSRKTKNNMSKSKEGVKNHRYGKILSEETKSKISKSQKLRWIKNRKKNQ